MSGIPGINAQDSNGNWAGDEVGYSGIHHRLRSWRGHASRYSCVDCGQPAMQWSYDGSDADQRVDDHRGPYSIDLTRYQPRCTSCHRLRDGGCFRRGAAHPNSKLSDTDCLEISRLKERGVAPGVLALRYGIRYETVYKAIRRAKEIA